VGNPHLGQGTLQIADPSASCEYEVTLYINQPVYFKYVVKGTGSTNTNTTDGGVYTFQAHKRPVHWRPGATDLTISDSALVNVAQYDCTKTCLLTGNGGEAALVDMRGAAGMGSVPVTWTLKPVP
jgi:hypothetical protein